MAGVTNAAFRTLCRRFGAGLYVSEMLTARALLEGHRPTLRMVEFAPGEAPRSVQLYSADPRAVHDAVAMLTEAVGVDHIDFNLGCPASRITRNGGGAALPLHRPLLAAVLGAAVAAAGSVPVTAKFRKGIDDEHLTFIETGLIAESEGCSAVTLHARTAEQHYSGTADWSAIAELKQAVTTIPVLGNGDIWEAGDALRMIRETGCDGAVVGRGCLGRPWLFRDLADAFDGRQPQGPATIGEVVTVMIEHANLLVDWFGTQRALRDFRKHTSWYLTGYRVGRETRRRLNQVESIAELARLLHTLDLTQTLPPEAARMPRGHTSGPRKVALPRRYPQQTGGEWTSTSASEAMVSGG
ncbi:MAG: tRNA dihydrouridine synthase DusB [Actinobacteria bacterium]|nr:MAG: tRNA dihydrouridine synthase DusB [Actinomycetota bacterium]RIK08203.1 MAG: tRNA dihydrouridine synthase DusB [Acidobacteriota bacterium]